jgi:hypothetical protein
MGQPAHGAGKSAPSSVARRLSNLCDQVAVAAAEETAVSPSSVRNQVSSLDEIRRPQLQKTARLEIVSVEFERDSYKNIARNFIGTRTRF